ncbi:chorismate-binding protein [Flavobacterium sp.]|uniref:chorismate-binding protein n=1 Tax=Flavobacterium sp. TaxID=239 RepID=UPI0025D79DFD|nr:chorismate-binding protein [Flavobacterium sp.]
MTDLFLKVKIQQEQKSPFVLFCKPNSENIVGLFQKNDHLYFLENFEEKGFVFASFDTDKIPFIPLEHCDVYVEKFVTKEYFFEKHISKHIISTGKDSFEELVAKAVEVIKDNQFQKVVLSRKEEIPILDFDIETSIKKMIALYSNAFNYCFFHPKIGTWIGATPEQFLKVQGNTIKTVALAGTQLANNAIPVVWRDKEAEEQQLVTDFIVESLKDLVKEITISSPYAVQAGNLLHIKTDISATLKSRKTLKKVITALHPTAAVCGLPKETAKEFILKNERYNREYYSGFLGEFNIDLVTFKTMQIDLFVNLRCMKIIKDKAQLFMGCGITKDSIAEDEYKETVNKSMTMKKIL